MQCKAVFLDFYGTVVCDDGEIIAKICSRILRSSNKETTVQAVATYWWERFSRYTVASYGDSFRSQREIGLQSLEETIVHFGSNKQATDLSQKLHDYWGRPKIYPEAKEFFARLKLPIYIVSNIDRQDLLSAMNFHKLLEDSIFIVTSEDTRYYKPRAEIFTYALNMMALKPEDVVHIGDSFASDVRGARNAGITPIWLNRKSKVVNKECPQTIMCTDLLETLRYLE